jgi:hypothetical protein
MSPFWAFCSEIKWHFLDWSRGSSLHFRAPSPISGAVYTMDHEVVPRKRPILRGMTSWDDFHGPSY